MLYAALFFNLFVWACMGARLAVQPDDPMVDNAFTKKTKDDLKLIKTTLITNGADRHEAKKAVEDLYKELQASAKLNWQNLSSDLKSMREAMTEAGAAGADIEHTVRSLQQEIKSMKVSLDFDTAKEMLATLEDLGTDAQEMIAALGKAAKSGKDLLGDVKVGIKQATAGFGVIAEGIGILTADRMTTGQKVLASVKIIAGVSQVFVPGAGTVLASLCSFASAYLKDQAAPSMTSAIKSAIRESFEEVEDEQTRLNLAADLSELDASFSGLHVLYQNVADARANAYSIDWLVSVGWLSDRAVAYPGRRGLGRLKEFLRSRANCTPAAFRSEDCEKKARNFYRYAVLSHSVEVVHQAAKDLAVAMQATHSTLPQVENAMKDLQMDDRLVFCDFLEARADESQWAAEPRWAVKDALVMEGFGLDAAEHALVVLKFNTSGCLPQEVSPGAFFSLQNGGGKRFIVGLNPPKEGVKGHDVALATQQDHQWSFQPVQAGSVCPGCFTIVNRASGCVLSADWDWMSYVGCHDAAVLQKTAAEGSQQWLIKYRGDHVVLVNGLTNATLADMMGKGDMFADSYRPQDLYSQWELVPAA